MVEEIMNAKFLSYLVKRLMMALLTIFLVVAITFFVMHAIPASPFSSGSIEFLSAGLQV